MKEKPFVCPTCSMAFARQNDCTRHQVIHTGTKKFACEGKLRDGTLWGCGLGFARQDKLRDYFRSETGRRCITPMLAELQAQNSSSQPAPTLEISPPADNTSAKPIQDLPTTAKEIEIPEPGFQGEECDEFFNTLVQFDDDKA